MLRVVGAGLPRTGTFSLKMALEQLLGGPCYHMVEVLQQPDYAGVWEQAALGNMPTTWETVVGGYAASVDFPASAFWRELSSAYPEAVVLLSTRESPQQWWDSVDATVGTRLRDALAADGGSGGGLGSGGEPASVIAAMMAAVSKHRFTGDMLDPDAVQAVYERHNAEVRSEVDSSRLVEWKPGDGWEPICAALDLPVPAEPFPHENSRENFVGDNYHLG